MRVDEKNRGSRCCPRSQKITYHVDKEPVLCVDSVCVKEERSPDETLVKEVSSEVCKPVERVEASARFEHEEGNRLLDEETDDDGPPLDSGPVPRGRPETKLKHDETHDGNGAIAIFRSLWGRLASGTVRVGDTSRSTRTPSSLNPKVEPRATAMMESQPRAKRIYFGMRKKGSCTRETHTSSTGRVTALGMKRKAMIRMKDHAKKVCTIHRWRVAWRVMEEIHQPRMRRARPTRLTTRTRLCRWDDSLSEVLSTTSCSASTWICFPDLLWVEVEWNDFFSSTTSVGTSTEAIFSSLAVFLQLLLQTKAEGGEERRCRYRVLKYRLQEEAAELAHPWGSMMQ